MSVKKVSRSMESFQNSTPPIHHLRTSKILPTFYEFVNFNQNMLQLQGKSTYII